MFGKAPRGVSQRPKARGNTQAIPSWLWLVVLVLAGICVAIFLSLWSPWKPVERKGETQGPMAVNDQDTNKDYRFYDMLPQQQVTPIPDQAVPEHQVEQPVIVVEAPAPAQAVRPAGPWLSGFPRRTNTASHRTNDRTS